MNFLNSKHMQRMKNEKSAFLCYYCVQPLALGYYVETLGLEVPSYVWSGTNMSHRLFLLN